MSTIYIDLNTLDATRDRLGSVHDQLTGHARALSQLASDVEWKLRSLAERVLPEYHAGHPFHADDHWWSSGLADLAGQFGQRHQTVQDLRGQSRWAVDELARAHGSELGGALVRHWEYADIRWNEVLRAGQDAANALTPGNLLPSLFEPGCLSGPIIGVATALSGAADAISEYLDFLWRVRMQEEAVIQLLLSGIASTIWTAANEVYHGDPVSGFSADVLGIIPGGSKFRTVALGVAGIVLDIATGKQVNPRTAMAGIIGGGIQIGLSLTPVGVGLTAAGILRAGAGAEAIEDEALAQSYGRVDPTTGQRMQDIGDDLGKVHDRINIGKAFDDVGAYVWDGGWLPLAAGALTGDNPLAMGMALGVGEHMGLVHANTMAGDGAAARTDLANIVLGVRQLDVDTKASLEDSALATLNVGAQALPLPHGLQAGIADYCNGQMAQINQQADWITQFGFSDTAGN